MLVKLANVQLGELFYKTDYLKNKMQSLVNDHSLKIDYSYAELDIDKLRNKQDFSSQIDRLPDGAFLIRILEPAANEKFENIWLFYGLYQRGGIRPFL